MPIGRNMNLYKLRDPSDYVLAVNRKKELRIQSPLATSRIANSLKVLLRLPSEQPGFRQEKSTMAACGELFIGIRTSLVLKKVRLQAVFVDFKSAFDTAPGRLVESDSHVTSAGRYAPAESHRPRRRCLRAPFFPSDHKVTTSAR